MGDRATLLSLSVPSRWEVASQLQVDGQSQMGDWSCDVEGSFTSMEMETEEHKIELQEAQRSHFASVSEFEEGHKLLQQVMRTPDQHSVDGEGEGAGSPARRFNQRSSRNPPV